ncbi:hypothetical protein Efla_001821 [Eimeria flavescens]
MQQAARPWEELDRLPAWQQTVVKITCCSVLLLLLLFCLTVLQAHADHKQNKEGKECEQQQQKKADINTPQRPLAAQGLLFDSEAGNTLEELKKAKRKEKRGADDATLADWKYLLDALKAGETQEEKNSIKTEELPKPLTASR